MKTYQVKVENLVFSAAHFLISSDFGVEALHGHNFAVEITFEKNIIEDGIVLDFVLLRDYAEKILKKLDHKLLIPSGNPDIKIEQVDKNVSISADGIILSLKTNNVMQIPFVNTSAELIAEHIAQSLLTKLRDSGMLNGTGAITVGVSEEPGCQGICKIEF